jgi:hypothetical protein
VEYMGMAGCWREACNVGAVIVSGGNVKVYRVLFWDSIVSMGMHMLPPTGSRYVEKRRITMHAISQ